MAEIGNQAWLPFPLPNLQALAEAVTPGDADIDRPGMKPLTRAVEDIFSSPGFLLRAIAAISKPRAALPAPTTPAAGPGSAAGGGGERSEAGGAGEAMSVDQPPSSAENKSLTELGQAVWDPPSAANLATLEGSPLGHGMDVDVIGAFFHSLLKVCSF